MTHSEWHIHSDRMSCKDQRPEIKHSRKHGERYRKWMGSQWDRETACDVFLSFIACGQPQHNESGGSATCTRNKDQEVDLGKGRLGGLLAAERQSSLLKSFLCPRLTSYPWGPQMTSLKNKIELPWDGKFQDKKTSSNGGLRKILEYSSVFKISQRGLSYGSKSHPCRNSQVLERIPIFF